MNDKSIQVSAETLSALAAAAAGEGRTVEEVLALAVADYRHRSWLARCDAAYAALPKQSSDVPPATTRPRAALQAAFKAFESRNGSRRRRRGS